MNVLLNNLHANISKTVEIFDVYQQNQCRVAFYKNLKEMVGRGGGGGGGGAGGRLSKSNS